MVVTLHRNRRSGHFTRAGCSNILLGSSSSVPKVVAAPITKDPFVLSATMNPDSVHSPLFLHSADYPGLILVSVQLD